MIQRIQSVWLFLASLCGFALTRVPLYSGRLANNVIENKLATDNILFFALIIGTALLALACIFLFRNRNLQFKLTVTGILLSVGMVAFEVWYIDQYKTAKALVSGTYYWGGLLPIAMAIFYSWRQEAFIKTKD